MFRFIGRRLLVAIPTLMSFNFIGDGLRDAIDPKDR
jgi:ABC-type dipeptide/oligopeptide/nickel transport system permease subunit